MAGRSKTSKSHWHPILGWSNQPLDHKLVVWLFAICYIAVCYNSSFSDSRILAQYVHLMYFTCYFHTIQSVHLMFFTRYHHARQSVCLMYSTCYHHAIQPIHWISLTCYCCAIKSIPRMYSKCHYHAIEFIHYTYFTCYYHAIQSIPGIYSTCYYHAIHCARSEAIPFITKQLQLLWDKTISILFCELNEFSMSLSDEEARKSAGNICQQVIFICR